MVRCLSQLPCAEVCQSRWCQFYALAYAGERMQMHRNGDVIQWFSRKGIDHGVQSDYNILNSLVKQRLRSTKCVLDGELLVWNTVKCAAHPVSAELLIKVAQVTAPASRVLRRQDWIPEDGPHAAIRYFVATASLGQHEESSPSRRRRLARQLSERSAELQTAREQQGQRPPGLSLSLDMTLDEATQDARSVSVAVAAGRFSWIRGVAHASGHLHEEMISSLRQADQGRRVCAGRSLRPSGS